MDIRKTVWAAVLAASMATLWARCEEEAAAPAETEVKAPAEGHSEEAERKRYPILMYIPNRAFDLLDVLRLRVRLGPGTSVGARVTKPLGVFFGAHTTGYVGLRGSRGKAEIPWPMGAESNAGAQVAVVGESGKGENAPVIDPLEVGAEVQFLGLGLSGAVETLEILDFAAGLLFIDLRDDDF